MKSVYGLILALVATQFARADFSYATARKTAEGAASAAAAQTTKYYLKGQKMKVEIGDTATIMDFDAQTVTTIRNSQKTFSVTPFSGLGQALQQANAQAQVDVKETGQRKTINGYNASQLILTMALDSPQMGRANLKMQVEMEMWLSQDVPGAEQLRSFYQKNGSRFPWAALGGGGNPGVQDAMAELQKKVAAMGGVPVLQVIRAKSAGNDAQAAQMQQGMAQARARLEEMSKQGGPAAAAAQQALARMGAAGGGSGPLFETTMESRDFSTSAIPDSVFAVPPGFQKSDVK